MKSEIMKLRRVSLQSFREIRAGIHATPLYSHPSAFLWQKCLSFGNQFCEAVVSAGYLSWEQMLNASSRYCIGASKLGGVIFWQIDREGRVHDGKVMYYLPDCHRNKDGAAHPTWVSALLARRNGNPRGTSSHCFFGLHLLPCTSDNGQWPLDNEDFSDGGRGVAIVEAEKSAFILSELYPQYVWLASGGLAEVQPEKFRPLRGCRVVMFPDTDPDGSAFRRWSEAAALVMRSVFWEDCPPIRVSPILELHASPEQKLRKIDLVDFLFNQ